MQNKNQSLSKFEIWALAARPKTLPAAAATVIVGSAAAYYQFNFKLLPALACLLAALLMQIGANLANDLFDFYRGADQGDRLGPLRVTQAGLLQPKEVVWGLCFTFGCASLLGIYLFSQVGWPVLVIGLASILAALTYTGGPFPFGYYGLGDLMVFIFFGLVAVCGTYFVQAGHVSRLALWSAIPMGFLITGILVVNNLRDLDSDRAVGKKTLAVFLGAQGARWEYLLCLLAAFVFPLIGILTAQIPFLTLLSLLCIPMAIRLVRSIWTVSGRPLNLALAGTGRLTLVFGILYSFGLIAACLIEMHGK